MIRGAFGFVLGVACTVGIAALFVKWAAEDWVKGGG